MTFRLIETHIEVEDLAKSFNLYAQLIPYEKVVRWGDKETRYVAAFVLKDGSAFGLWEKGKIGIHGGRGGEHQHFAFQIKPEEYSDYFCRIQLAGLTPQEHTWPSGHKSVYFEDYDGHQGEFITGNWFELN